MQKDTPTTHGQFLHSFDGLRGIAVVLVLLQHETFLAKKYLGVQFAGGVFGLGDFRIDIFFVLSGFFAAWVAGRGREAENPGIHFLGRRLRRLLPLLWVLTSVKLVLMFSLDLPGRHEGMGWFQLLRSYTLLPAPGYPIILPAWTLSFELVFCALWSVLLFFRQRIRLVAMGLWALGIVAYGMAYLRPSMSLPGFAMHPYFLDFIAGVLLAEIAPFRAIKLRGSMIMGIGGALLGMAMAVQPELKDDSELARRIVWGGAAFVMVVGLFVWEGQRGAFVMPRVLRLLARSSYSIYLTHSLVLYLAMKGLAAFSTHSWGTHLVLVALAAAALGVGILVNRWVEVPLQRALIFLKARGRASLLPRKSEAQMTDRLSGD
jgi:peptidoglycan/LPS O-acetylase OafA/YrhL